MLVKIWRHGILFSEGKLCNIILAHPTPVKQNKIESNNCLGNSTALRIFILVVSFDFSCAN